MVFETPCLEIRPEQPYVGARISVKMADISKVIPPLLDSVFEWLGKQGIEPHAAPFFRYIVVDMENELEMEVGIPVETPLQGEGPIQAGVLPAGRYATLHHTGPYEQLYHATEELLAWAKKQNLMWKTAHIDGKEVWESRLEFYLNDPALEPNPQKWETQLAFLLAE